jgi:hypothetical protein
MQIHPQEYGDGWEEAKRSAMLCLGLASLVLVSFGTWLMS